MSLPLISFFTSMSMQLKLQKPTPKRSTTLKTNLSVFERAVIGASAGGPAGGFTYFCLHPLDTISKLSFKQKELVKFTKIPSTPLLRPSKLKGFQGFTYSGVIAVIVGSTFSSALLFCTCEFGKSFLSKFETYPPLLIPPTASLMGSIISSAMMVPKELITQRMQADAKDRSWEIIIQMLQKDGVLGLYTGYSATLLRNLPAVILSYSSFEWLKTAVLVKKKNEKMTPLESVCCGALAGAISASLTTPLDVVKTKLMTLSHGVAVSSKGPAVMIKNSGVSANVKQILLEEGWVGFTIGMGARVVYRACFSAIFYFAFETARLAILDQYLKHKHQSKEMIMGLNPS